MWSRCLGVVSAMTLIVFGGQAAPKQEDEKPIAPVELHVAALYEGAKPAGVPGAGGTAAVVVDRPGADVILVVSAYNSVTWTVTASPKTNLKKVILAGYHGQAAVVPKGTLVEDWFHEGRQGKEYLRAPYKIDSPEFRPFVQALRALTGQEVKSFRGTHRFNAAAPFTVDGVQDEPRLSSKYPTLTKVADQPKVKFQGVHLVAADRFGVSGSVGDFTQDGPAKDTLKPLPDTVVRLVHDPKGKKDYGLTMHEVCEVDLEKKKTVNLDPGVALERISWPRAITFDTKRDRLLVVASKLICEYVPATGKWGVVAELPRGIEMAGLAYHAKDDTLYAVGQGFGEDARPTLYQMNAQGAVLRSAVLSAPVFPGLLGRMDPERGIQLVSAGTHLALVTGGPGPRDGNGQRGKGESFLFLIDPAEGDKVTLEWKE